MFENLFGKLTAYKSLGRLEVATFAKGLNKFMVMEILSNKNWTFQKSIIERKKKMGQKIKPLSSFSFRKVAKGGSGLSS